MLLEDPSPSMDCVFCEEGPEACLPAHSWQEHIVVLSRRISMVSDGTAAVVRPPRGCEVRRKWLRFPLPPPEVIHGQTKAPGCVVCVAWYLRVLSVHRMCTARRRPEICTHMLRASARGVFFGGKECVWHSRGKEVRSGDSISSCHLSSQIAFDTHTLLVTGSLTLGSHQIWNSVPSTLPPMVALAFK